MSELFRSEDMAYVSLTIPGETAHATITAVAKLNAFHLVDLSTVYHQPKEQQQHVPPPPTTNGHDSSHAQISQPISNSTTTAVVDHSVPSSDVDAAASEAPRPDRFYKRRMADCVSWEKQLEKYVLLKSAFPSIPPIPCIAGGDVIHVDELQHADLLEALQSYFEPFERELMFNSSFEQECLDSIQTMTERRWVIDLLKGLDLNDEVEQLQQKIAANQQNAPEFQQRNSLSRATSPGTVRSGNGKFNGIEMGSSLKSNDSGQLVDARKLRSLVPAHERFKNFVCGTLPARSQSSFSRLLYRLSRGNALFRFADMPESSSLPLSATSKPIEKKVVFYVIYLGRHLENRIKKLVELEAGTLYDLPHAEELVEAAVQATENKKQLTSADSSIAETQPPPPYKEEEEKKLNSHPSLSSNSPTALIPPNCTSTELYSFELASLDRSIQEKVTLYHQTHKHIRNLLLKLFRDQDTQGRETCPLLNFMEALKKEKVLCDVFQKAQFYQSLVAIEGWVPTRKISELQSAVKEAVRGRGAPPAMVEINPIATLRPPGVAPTSFPLNKFTSTFQGIVDTYGIPRYKEVNPGLFTITSFPFLFGIMYGDVGHGIILTLAAFYLIMVEKKMLRQQARGQLNEIVSMVFEGRYMIIMMGLFAIYAGTIYNDVFSVNTRVFDSGYKRPNDNELYTMILNNRPYPYGLDSAWQDKTNELAFYNSFKMKLAVIIGVTQMTFGIFLSAFNHVYFGDYVSCFFEFIPRLIFLVALFGYMDFLIIYKWCVDWSAPHAGEPPNLIQTMIQMFLSPGNVSAEHLLYEHQGLVQAILVLVAVFSIPVMLCVKPCWHKHVYYRDLRLSQLSPPALGGVHMGKIEEPTHGLVPIPNVSNVPGLTHEPLDEKNVMIEMEQVKKVDAAEQKESPLTINPAIDTVSPKINGLSPPNDSQSPLITNDHIHTNGNGTSHHDSLTVPTLPEQPQQTRQNSVSTPYRLKKELTIAPDPPIRLISHASNPPSPIIPHPLASPGPAKETTTPTAASDDGHGGHGHEFSFGDEMIHQSIHTIEFVLGTVSNTASYLRLWALSLAHQQLSQVFWNKMLLQYGINNSAALSVTRNENSSHLNSVLAFFLVLIFAWILLVFSLFSSFIGYFIWAVATFSVLLCMDVLECFLHALRLHWVEFQNKFFYADGKAFEPISFNLEAKAPTGAS